MIRRLTKDDVGKIVKRRDPHSTTGAKDYLLIREVDEKGYVCDFIEKPWILKNVPQLEAKSQSGIYDYEESSALEVLVVLGVVI